MSRITIAVPSKGRLKEQTEDWLASIGHTVRQIGGERGYTAEIEGIDAEVRLLSASEIAQGLIDGSLHLGVTGEDLLHDLSPDGPVDFEVLKRLGFGGADVVVAVPQAWFDVDTMADLEAAGAAFRKAHHRRLRVATKYLRITRRYFAQKSVGEYRLVESAGATEAAPATGTADVIVDITTTGATLRANGLKVLDDGVILKSQASLTRSIRAPWSAEADAIVELLMRQPRAETKRPL
ncbi:MAG: ATP phosphoribosyltransferase [Hyphomonas sp.]|uniref:ATP phosphoribosyltransferase n=1 Tax=Hyphomonas sp. TaxID=87 RepID=UPI001D7CB2E1|nr:ATP phosphoribosyltransferase [Hyphomonas sp.]MBA4226417.1 ATP phosphoribosyltransferase [Hyphomonas sp.]